MFSVQAIEIPLIKATNDSLKGYGYLIDSYEDSDIEIITWPKQGWREIDDGTGNEGGATEGSFDTWWDGSTLYGQNNAVQHNSEYEKDDKYILAHSTHPEALIKNQDYKTPNEMYLWHVMLLCSGSLSGNDNGPAFVSTPTGMAPVGVSTKTETLVCNTDLALSLSSEISQQRPSYWTFGKIVSRWAPHL